MDRDGLGRAIAIALLVASACGTAACSTPQADLDRLRAARIKAAEPTARQVLPDFLHAMRYIRPADIQKCNELVRAPKWDGRVYEPITPLSPNIAMSCEAYKVHSPKGFLVDLPPSPDRRYYAVWAAAARTKGGLPLTAKPRNIHPHADPSYTVSCAFVVDKGQVTVTDGTPYETTKSNLVCGDVDEHLEAYLEEQRKLGKGGVRQP